MSAIVQDPETRELFLDGAGTMVMYAFDGTPLSRRELPQVGEVACLFDWQADPGQYGPAFVLADVWPQGQKSTFTAGGSFLYVCNWCKDHDAAILRSPRLFGDRNVVRRMAEQAQGVAW